MTLIRISQLRPGMVVGSDVKDRSGRILLTTDTVLNEKNIKVIKSWGVVEVDVAAELAGAANATIETLPGVNQDQLLAFESDLNHRFRFVNKSHPLIHELFDVCLERLIERNREIL